MSLGRTRNEHHRAGWLLRSWTVGVVLFVLGPLVLILAVSLTPKDVLSWPSGEISLRWYARMLERPAFVQSAWNSLVLALGSSAAAVALGLLAALGLDRSPGRFAKGLLNGLMSPLFVPMILSGLAILIAYTQMGWTHQASRLWVAHTALTLPYALRTISASLQSFDRRQELAAQNLGAGQFRTLLYVTLPQLGPGLFAAGLFAFIVSFDNVGLSLFLTGPSFSTLPVELFSYASYNSDPVIAAVSITMVLLSVAAVLLVERVFGLARFMR
ncbi:ABC transporter permease [Ottowia thiooxydans]|uniref:ABC transporter permease n=1 Tax=Ottowia thiooxydans TaxID=219182 RepID=UPI00040D8400|nr:ABC transporter permease [Ottowia thiooxydans]